MESLRFNVFSFFLSLCLSGGLGWWLGFLWKGLLLRGIPIRIPNHRGPNSRFKKRIPVITSQGSTIYTNYTHGNLARFTSPSVDQVGSTWHPLRKGPDLPVFRPNLGEQKSNFKSFKDRSWSWNPNLKRDKQKPSKGRGFYCWWFRNPTANHLGM